MKEISKLIAFHLGLHIPPCDPHDPVHPVSSLIGSACPFKYSPRKIQELFNWDPAYLTGVPLVREMNGLTPLNSLQKTADRI